MGGRDHENENANSPPVPGLCYSEGETRSRNPEVRDKGSLFEGRRESVGSLPSVIGRVQDGFSCCPRARRFVAERIPCRVRRGLGAAGGPPWRASVSVYSSRKLLGTRGSRPRVRVLFTVEDTSGRQIGYVRSAANGGSRIVCVRPAFQLWWGPGSGCRGSSNRNSVVRRCHIRGSKSALRRWHYEVVVLVPASDERAIGCACASSSSSTQSSSKARRRANLGRSSLEPSPTMASFSDEAVPPGARGRRGGRKRGISASGRGAESDVRNTSCLGFRVAHSRVDPVTLSGERRGRYSWSGQGVPVVVPCSDRKGDRETVSLRLFACGDVWSRRSETQRFVLGRLHSDA